MSTHWPSIRVHPHTHQYRHPSRMYALYTDAKEMDKARRKKDRFFFLFFAWTLFFIFAIVRSSTTTTLFRILMHHTCYSTFLSIATCLGCWLLAAIMELEQQKKNFFFSHSCTTSPSLFTPEMLCPLHTTRWIEKTVTDLDILDLDILFCADSGLKHKQLRRFGTWGFKILEKNKTKKTEETVFEIFRW